MDEDPRSNRGTLTSQVSDEVLCQQVLDMRECDQERILGITQRLMTKTWNNRGDKKNINTSTRGEAYQLRSRFPVYVTHT